MIADFAEFENAATVNADVCIVGAGAAGIAIAREFIGTPYKVLILESGGLDPEPETQELYKSNVVGLPHAGIHDGRVRIFGGTTTLWGGQALRFDAFDLQERSWVPYSGWPITQDMLEPFYERAARVLQLGPLISYHDLCGTFGIEPPALNPTQLYMECSQWSPKPNFATTYHKQLNRAKNVTALLHSNVTSVITNKAATTVEKIEFMSLAGKKGTARARFYIICCGGIETARLLLASNGIQEHGIGNDHDLLGRYFQEHIHIRFGQFAVKHRKRLQNLFESFYKGGLKYFPLITLSQRMQAEKKLLSIHGSPIFDDTEGSGVVALKQLFKILVRKSNAKPGELRHLVGNALISPGDILRIGYRFYAKHRSGGPRQGAVSMGAQAEVAPNPQSRVFLAPSRDRLGMRKISIDWRLGELERRTVSEYAGTVATEFERIGLASLNLRQVDILNDPVQWVTMARDSAHHMGTARMHETPQFGVVDPNCRVHGVDNLYIGSSAVFPTCTRSNPTLTILALCLRIADRLKNLLD
jgi:choline dehydrogenase-like flavoprotein